MTPEQRESYHNESLPLAEERNSLEYQLDHINALLANSILKHLGDLPVAYENSPDNQRSI